MAASETELGRVEEDARQDDAYESEFDTHLENDDSHQRLKDVHVREEEPEAGSQDGAQVHPSTAPEAADSPNRLSIDEPDNSSTEPENTQTEHDHESSAEPRLAATKSPEPQPRTQRKYSKKTLPPPRERSRRVRGENPEIDVQRFEWDKPENAPLKDEAGESSGATPGESSEAITGAVFAFIEKVYSETISAPEHHSWSAFFHTYMPDQHVAEEEGDRDHRALHAVIAAAMHSKGTRNMQRDDLTKALSRQKFEHFRALLNLQDAQRLITSMDGANK